MVGYCARTGLGIQPHTHQIYRTSSIIYISGTALDAFGASGANTCTLRAIYPNLPYCTCQTLAPLFKSIILEPRASSVTN